MPIGLPIKSAGRSADDSSRAWFDAAAQRGVLGAAGVRRVDPLTGRRRYRSTTVRGSRAEAERELAAMVASVRSVRSIGLRSSVSELLEAWFAVASTTRAPTTIRQARSVLDRYLHPHLGETKVGELTTADIDRASRCCPRGAAGAASRWCRAPWRASTWCCAPRPRRRCDGGGSGTTRPSGPIGSSRPGRSCIRYPEELGVLLEYLREDDPGLHTFVTLAVFTGGRQAQLLGLRWPRRRTARAANGGLQAPYGCRPASASSGGGAPRYPACHAPFGLSPPTSPPSRRRARNRASDSERLTGRDDPSVHTRSTR
jgi:hypothetical protein